MLALFTAFGKDHTFNEETVASMGDFFSPRTWEDAGKWKFTHLCDCISFVSLVTPRIDDYWVCLRDELALLRKDVFGGMRRQAVDLRDRHLFENSHSDDSTPSILFGSLHLTNVQPITHDKFLHRLCRMFEMAKRWDELDIQQEEERQVSLRAVEQQMEEARMILKRISYAKEEIRQRGNIAVPSSRSTYLTSTTTATSVTDVPSHRILDGGLNPFTDVQGDSLILESVGDELPPTTITATNSYFTPLSCIGLSQAAHFHIPSSDLPPENHVPLAGRAIVLPSKRVSDDDEYEGKSSKRRRMWLAEYYRGQARPFRRADRKV
jgi:hypothetical protein